MGDFTGFTFGDWHSTDLTTGAVTVLRVSSGDRYDEELHPEIKDRTAEVPGLNGQYYFGSDYGPRTFDIDIAFDSLTEEQFRQLRRVFGTKEIKQLIFDERPYKKYMAKLESPIELSYVCFDEPKRHIATQPSDGIRRITRTEQEPVINEETGDPVIDEETGEPAMETVTYRDLESIYPYVMDEGTQRIYKGEGKISLICHYPFALSVFKELPEGSEDWAVSSGILSAEIYENFDTFTILNPTDSEEIYIGSTIRGFRLYNAGDIETPCKIYCPFDNSGKINSLSMFYYSNESDNGLTGLKLANVTKSNLGNDIGILINTQTGLIQGVASLEPLVLSSCLYNKYITGGSFFKIQPNLNYEDGAKLIIEGVTDGMEIFYDYLYY